MSMSKHNQIKRPDGQGRQYWRSLDELAETPEFRSFVEREFPSAASELLDSTRRGFLKLMGASLALAGLGGCIRWPGEKITPYAHRPADRMPGVPVTYATAFELGGIGQGILVESYDGRPIKIEGNPGHPLNRGATDVFGQATVLDVYDPDRSHGVTRLTNGRGVRATWEEFANFVRTELPADGASLFVLSEATGSPSIQDLRRRLVAARPRLQWYEYEPGSEDAGREGTRAVFGQPLRAVLALDQAAVIVSLDADLFGPGNPLSIKYARDFMAGRKLYETMREPAGAAAEMNRLFVVESVFSTTGASADHRRAVAPAQILALANQIGAAVGSPHADAGMGDSGLDQLFVQALIDQLNANKGRSVVVAGPRQPEVVHSLVAEINRTLGNVGRTIRYLVDPEPARPSHLDAIADLVRRMNAGDVQSLVILGGDPVYDAPADLAFGEALGKVKNSVHLSPHLDETSQRCAWHLSRNHFLESWGDVRTFDGTVSIVQPLIEPLFDGRSAIELLALLANDQEAIRGGGLAIVQRTFKGLLGNDATEWRWKRALFEGLVEGTAFPEWNGQPAAPGDPAPGTPSVQGAMPATRPGGDYTLVFYTDRKVFDGRFANNGWLQELPDPMTRLTWDNAALVSPKTAQALGIDDYQIVLLQAGGREIRAPIYIMPGMPEKVIALALGYGRNFGGAVSQGVGVNAYALRTAAAIAAGSLPVSVRRTSETYPLATVQQHHIVDTVGKKALQRRVPELVRERTFEMYAKDPAVGNKKILTLSVFDEHKFDGRVDGYENNKENIPEHDFHRWGMAIDLTACTGCSACVVACQAENNIPIVGKEQVLHGREMHWLRIDRYFRETPEQPVAVHQPVLCMHCENAPCEEVCPVAATTHSQEGINMMTYNRCIGTRYCSNNCPYKVRRFNFFDYNRGSIGNLYTPNLLRQEASELNKLQKNPEVTVRTRGIMEKCTYCVQRIENTRIKAKREGDRPIRDGEILTACQQVCPTGAIVFGDLNQDGRQGRPESRVHQLQRLGRTYGMLDPELNTKPRTQYITKLRNPAGRLDEALYRVEEEYVSAAPEQHTAEQHH